MMRDDGGSAPAIRLAGAGLAHGERRLWHGLDLAIERGEFVCVLGPNGAGKSSLLKVLLGLQPLTEGTVEIEGAAARRGSSRIGYIPQQRAIDRDLPIRGRDLVQLGVDGHRWGLPFVSQQARQQVDDAIRAVGAERYADKPIGLLSGGEQQRLRIAQALLGDPRVLLCDEPLLSLDLNHQRAVTHLIDERRREAGTAVVFVTHEINPVLPYVDRVLYLACGKWAVGRPHEVLTTERLTDLFGSPVEVLHVEGRIIVVSSEDEAHTEPSGHHHHVDAAPRGRTEARP